MIWEALLENESMKNIKEYAWQDDEKITATKAEMKKPSFKYKVTKMAEIKKLQEEVQDLHDQKRTRNEEVVAH